MGDWTSTSLTEAHDHAAFHSGVEPLDAWLRTHAWRAQRSDTARTYVWTAPADARVVGYFSIAPTQVLRAEVSAKAAGGYSVIPGYLLARLALDTSLRGRGLGSQLLVDAVGRMVGVAEAGGGRLIVVDAISAEAAAFYRHHDLTPVRDNPRRLVLTMATARKALGVG